MRMKKTVIIIIIIFVSVGLGYAYERITVEIEKKRYPIMYEEFVEKYSHEYAVPKEIIYSVIRAESGFQSNIVSSAGAIGLMQIMPNTFEDISNRLGEEIPPKELWEELLYAPNTNIKYGTFYLRYLHNEFEDWDIVFAAYNAGPTRVRNQWLTNPEYIKDNKIIYIPIEETRNYIKRVNDNWEKYKKLYFSGEQ